MMMSGTVDMDLFRAYQPMALALAKRFSRYSWSALDQDSACSEALLALVEGLNTFDASKGMSCNTYLNQVVYRALCEATRKLLGRKTQALYGTHVGRSIKAIQDFEPVSNEAESLPQTMTELACDAHNPYAHVDWHDEWQFMTAALPATWQRVLRLRLDGHGIISISQQIGCSKSWVSRLLHRIAERLATHYNCREQQHAIHHVLANISRVSQRTDLKH